MDCPLPCLCRHIARWVGSHDPFVRTALSCLFKLKDQNQLKKIHEEIGSDVDLERFDKLFEYATSKPYGFFAIDFNPKSPDQTFRCCFNEYLA